jgi:hypothetical protein
MVLFLTKQGTVYWLSAITVHKVRCPLFIDTQRISLYRQEFSVVAMQARISTLVAKTIVVAREERIMIMLSKEIIIEISPWIETSMMAIGS